MTSHTDGPWINCHSHVDDSRGVTLCKSTRSFEELNPLDFKLMAAAPELLEAAKRMVRDQNRPVFSMDFGGSVKALEAAIKKATE